MKSSRIAGDLRALDALAWLSEAPEGATALVVTTARGTPVTCAPTREAAALIDAALERALAEGATRALLWQAQGLVLLGAPVAIAGAVAASRKEALRAVDTLLVGLKGVAAREDVAT